MPTSERKSLPDPRTFEEADSWREDLEEKEMHRLFIQDLNRREIYFSHSRFDKPTSYTRGTPDFICQKNGLSLNIEFKTAKGVLSEEQIEQGRQIINAGNKFHVCRSVESAIKIVKEVFGV